MNVSNNEDGEQFPWFIAYLTQNGLEVSLDRQGVKSMTKLIRKKEREGERERERERERETHTLTHTHMYIYIYLMQSSSNELSSLVSDSVKCKQTKVDTKYVKFPSWCRSPSDRVVS